MIPRRGQLRISNRNLIGGSALRILLGLRDFAGDRQGGRAQPRVRRLIVESAVPEHDAAQARGIERQLFDLHGIQAAKLQRDLPPEHGDHIGLPEYWSC